MIEKIIDNQSIQTYSYRFLQLISENEHNIGTNFAQGADGINRMYASINLPNLPNNARIKKASVKLKQIAANLLETNTKILLFQDTCGIIEGQFEPGGEELLVDCVSTKTEADAEYTFDITKLFRNAVRTGEMQVGFGLKLLCEGQADGVSVTLSGTNGSCAPEVVLEYESNYAVGSAYQTTSHQLCRLGSGSVDIAESNLMFELEDFAWGGNRMPVTIRHLYNSTLYNQQYTQNENIQLLAADFSAMKLGDGWRLNIMQSMVPHTFRYDGNEYTGYIHIGESGEETFFKPKEAIENPDGTYKNLNTFEDVTDEDTIYDANTRTLTMGGEKHLFDECGRLIKITDEYQNSMVITYEQGKIVSVCDGAGRVFSFRYNSDDFLSTIIAPDNSHIIYTYSADKLCDIYYSGGESLRFNYIPDGMDYDGKISEVTVYEADGTAAKKYLYDYRAKGVHGVEEYGAKNGVFTKGSYTTHMVFYSENKTIVGYTSYESDGVTVSQNITTEYIFDNDGNVIGQSVNTTDGNMCGIGFDPTANDGTGLMAYKGNLLKNHNFESAEHWQAVSDGITYNIADDKSALYGEKVMQIKNENELSFSMGIEQLSEILTVGKYTFSAYIKIPEELSGGGAYLRVVDTEDNTLAVSEKFRKKSEEFIRFACPFRVDADACVKVQILLDGAGEIYADAAALERNEFALDYDLLTNGNFELGNLGWTLSSGAEISAEKKLNMQNSLKLTSNFENTATAEQTINVKTKTDTRESFTLSGWANAVGVTDANAVFCLKAVIKYTDESLENDIFTEDFVPQTDGWQYVSLDFAKKQFAQVDNITVVCEYSGNNGSAYFDNISLVRSGIETGLTADDFNEDEEENTESEESVTNSSAEEEQNEFEEAMDAFGNALTETTFNDEDFGTIYRSFAYSEDGNDLIAETDAKGNSTEYDVDALTSRNKEITDRLGNKTAYEYDINGRTTRVTSKTADNTEIANVSYKYDASDNLSEIMRGDGLKYVLKYNAFKNLESIGIEGKDTKLVSYTYKTSGGRLKEIAYANGHKMRASYNGNGNMIAERWFDSDENLTAYYRYGYDEQGNIVRSVDIFAHKEYNYYYEDGVLKRSVESDIVTDESDFVISKTAVVTVIYVYNNDGELAKKRVVFADDTEQEFVYIIEEKVENTENETQTPSDTETQPTPDTETEGGNIVEGETVTQTEIKWQYDEDGNLIWPDEWTELLETEEGKTVIAGAISSEIKNASRPATSTVQTEGEAKEYKEKVTFKMGETEFTSRSDYDGFGRKSFDELKLGKGFISRQFSYHAGKVTEAHRNNDKLQSAPVTQLVSQIILLDGRTLNYEYDKEERVTKVIDSIEGTTEYTYDALGQLLTETKNGQNINTMTYDNYGNILTKNGKIYTYGDNVWKDKLTKFDGLDITYDSQGNPINYLGHNLTWEKGRQLKTFDDNIYGYNANGIRIFKTVYNIRHEFTLDGAKILKETWENNVLTPLYDNADDVCGIIYNGTPYFFIKNLQGDVIAITDDNGETVAKYSYDAWGVCSILQDTNGIANINPYRYRSYYYDAETGMYYLQSRYYNPNVGRFVNGDEVKYLGANNTVLSYDLFCYCESEPVSNYDPFGFYIMYIYGKDQKKAADVNYKILSEKFLVYKYQVKSSKKFTEVWNTKGTNCRNKLAKIDIMIINLHGNPNSVEYMNLFSLVRRNIDTLLLLSCNAGHQDYKKNVAFQIFNNNNIRKLVCCDGTHYRPVCFGKVVHKVIADDDFRAYTEGKRKSQGFIVYERTQPSAYKSYSIGSRFGSIKALLKKIGKW